MFMRHVTADENVSRDRSLRQLSTHDSLISIFRRVDMFMRHTTENENVSCES